MNKKTTYVTLAALMAVVILLVWGNLSPRSREWDEAISHSGATRGTLGAPVPAFDFGSISMAKGKVSHDFELVNETGAEIALSRAMTSCMCTEAFLRTGSGKEFGPFGMPGHGFNPTFDMRVNPGETLTVRVVFDPAAHGPAGVGKVERIVEISNDKGRVAEMRIAATVTP